MRVNTKKSINAHGEEKISLESGSDSVLECTLF